MTLKSITFCNSWQDEVGERRNILHTPRSQEDCCCWHCLDCGISWSTLFFLVPFFRSKEGEEGGEDGAGKVEDNKSDQRQNGLAGKPLEWNLSCFLLDLVRAESKTDYQCVNTSCQILICFWSIWHFLFRVHLLLKRTNFHGLCWSNVDELVEKEGGVPTKTPRVVVFDLAGESNCATFCPMQALTRSLFKISIREREFLYFGLMHRCENENFFLSFSCFLSVNLVLQDENEKLKLNSQSRRGKMKLTPTGIPVILWSKQWIECCVT